MLVICNFVGKNKLNFQYKMMTKQMYYNFLKKHKKSVSQILKYHCTKKWSFPKRISSVHATTSAVNCGSGHIEGEILYGKLHFLCSLCKTLSNFDFNSTITKKIHWVVQLFGNKVIQRISLTSRTDHPN